MSTILRKKNSASGIFERSRKEKEKGKKHLLSHIQEPCINRGGEKRIYWGRTFTFERAGPGSTSEGGFVLLQGNHIFTVQERRGTKACHTSVKEVSFFSRAEGKRRSIHKKRKISHGKAARVLPIR